MKHGPNRLLALLFASALTVAACADDDEAPPNGAAAQAGMGGSTGTINVGGGPSCVRAEDANSAVVRPLGDRCSKSACPASIAEAAEQALGNCSNTFPPRITMGCGTTTVTSADFTGGAAYVFDATTMMLIGVRDGSDTPYGECRTNEYRYGDVPAACDEAIICYPCDDAEGGAAGAAGAADLTKPAPCPTF